MIIQSDILKWAETYDGPLFHAILTDPPYHLTSITDRFGKEGSKPARYGKDGAFQRASRGFMNTQWDGGDLAFRAETWAAITQHLYPGAFGMAFASSRGWHRMAVAIEDAGLIIHPSIFLYSYGSGFPKATRIPDERFTGHRYGLQAMKPAAEPIIVFQKPYAGRPVDCITRTGAGAINVDGGRIGTAADMNPRDFDDSRRTSPKFSGLYNGGEEGQYLARRGIVPNGRWPANLLLQHTPACRAAGSRRVRGSRKPTPYPSGDTTPYDIYGDYSERSQVQHADADGMETVTAWECFMGWNGAVPCYETVNAVFVPSAEPLYLLDRLPSLLRAIREYSKTCSTPLPDVAAFYRNGRTQSADSSVGLSDAVASALQVEGFPGSQFGCLSCRRSCDELLHQVLTACQDGLPSLFDALAHMHQCLSKHAHTPHCPLSDHLSSSDADRQHGTLAGTPESKTYADQGPSALLVPSHHNGGMAPAERPQNGRHDSTNGNSISATCNRETPHHSACNAAAAVILSLLSADLAWRFLLSESIITRKEIVINLPSCPVAALDAQSGASESKRSQRGAVKIFNDDFKGTEGWTGSSTERGHSDSGGASRFFHQSDWSYEIEERIAAADPVRYCAKASKAEREGGLDPMQIKLMGMMEIEGAEPQRAALSDRKCVSCGGWYPKAGRQKARPNSTCTCDAPMWDDEHFPETTVDDDRQTPIDNPYLRGETKRRNTHPTIKPLSLCRYLATLLLPPDHYAPRRILIPFAGAGSEAIGAMLAGWEEVVGVELEAQHVAIATARMAFWRALRYRLLDPSSSLDIDLDQADPDQPTLWDYDDAA